MMKKLSQNRIALVASLAFLYVLILVVSICAISAYPLSRQKNFFINQARKFAQQYESDPLASTELFSWQIDGRTCILVVDDEKKIVKEINADTDSPANVRYEQYLDRVLNGEEIFQFMFEQDRFPLTHGLMGVAGVPIKSEENTTGAVFLIRKTMAVTESLIGYFFFFTIFYWISAYFVISNIRKRKSLDEEQRIYIANVTHALKTPVASIKALAETLCDGVETDADVQKLYYGMILQESNRQGRMINDILELSRLQSNEKKLYKNTIPIKNVSMPVYEKYSAICDCVGITLSIGKELSDSLYLFTNEEGVKQVLEILLDNAVKYTKTNGHIWIEANVVKNKVTVSVRDDGIGISDRDLPYIFERFYKLNHERNNTGSGLGLAIAKEIILELNEKIWVESKLNKGTTFFFTIQCIPTKK